MESSKTLIQIPCDIFSHDHLEFNHVKGSGGEFFEVNTIYMGKRVGVTMIGRENAEKLRDFLIDKLSQN